jgi:hypothetical protein
MTGMDADDVTACPAGVALLEALEAEQRTDVAWFHPLTSADVSAIERAAATTAALTWGELVERLVGAAERIGGPWRSDALSRLALAFGLAPARRPIAEAVADHFTAAPREIDLDAQEWWLSDSSNGVPRRAFGRSHHVYCCGEFTWNGIWTVTSPPPEVHDDLIDVWELFPGPISRWRVPIRADACVFEVNRPADWARLVTEFPMRASRPHGGWELPGPNQPRNEARELELISEGSAVRTSAEVFMPDWAAVADAFDGVHLSWIGKLTCEGRVIDLPELGEQAASIVRYWSSERTLWLNDVFGTPSPFAAPALTGRINGDTGIDANEPQRLRADTDSIAAQLARDPFRR